MLDLAFRRDLESDAPLYRQLEAYMRGLVEAGRLRAGEKLPATRELASSLGLGRNTVALAYEALCDDGLLVAHVGQGTFVAARGRRREAQPESPTGRGFAWEGLMAARTRRLAFPEGAPPARGEFVHDFRAGNVDAETAPTDELRRAFSRALARHGRLIAEHRDPLGWWPLREAVARALVSRGISAEPDEVFITNGAQQALYMIARCLVDPGEAVALEQPGYFAAALAFSASGAHPVGVPVDECGMRTDRLARVLRARRVKLIYTTPAVQMPTGVVLDDARREQLLALADEHQTPIVEDDYDSELRVGSPPRPALKTRDAAGQVLYVGTFSKAVLPGLRIGYLVAPTPLLLRMALARLASDLGTHVVAQAALAEMMAAGDLERHVRRVRRLYASRLRALDAALSDAMPEGASWSLPAGGNTLWLRLPPRAAAEAVWQALPRAGIVATRGDVFYLDETGRDHLLLGVANLDEAGLAAGAQALGRVVKRAMRARKAA